MPMSKTKTKKPMKYHYFMNFKEGDYFEITSGLAKMYPVSINGCGIGIGGIYVSFFFTSQKIKNIKRHSSKRYPQFSVKR